jgi:hypothetical protein
LDFPLRHEAHKKAIKPFHKSLPDFLSRSGFSVDIKLEAQEIKTQCALWVLKEAPDGTGIGDVTYLFDYRQLDSTGIQISLTWRADEGIDWNDDRTRLSMYKLAIGEASVGMKRGDPVFQTDSCIRLLTT